MRVRGADDAAVFGGDVEEEVRAGGRAEVGGDVDLPVGQVSGGVGVGGVGHGGGGCGGYGGGV